LKAEAIVMLSAWEFDSDIAPCIAARAALEDRRAPDLEVLLVSDCADHVVVHVLEGEIRDERSIVLLGSRGLHRILATHESLPRATDGERRLRVMLAPLRYA
jgi:hypothetical protein